MDKTVTTVKQIMAVTNKVYAAFKCGGEEKPLLVLSPVQGWMLSFHHNKEEDFTWETIEPLVMGRDALETAFQNDCERYVGLCAHGDEQQMMISHGCIARRTDLS